MNPVKKALEAQRTIRRFYEDYEIHPTEFQETETEAKRAVQAIKRMFRAVEDHGLPAVDEVTSYLDRHLNVLCNVPSSLRSYEMVDIISKTDRFLKQREDSDNE